MKLTLTIAALVLAGVVSATAFAQLGPKDPTTQPPTDIDRVKAGQPAPDFTLEDSDGKAVTLADFRGKKSVVLVFYRGHW